MNYDLVIKNGRVISGGSDFIGDVAVKGEKIAALGQGLSGETEVDASGKLVIPGAIDGHVHMRTERPSWVYDETFASGSVAAAFGGTTTMIDQVQAQYGLTLNEELDTRLALAEDQTAIDYTFHMNIREPIVERLNEMQSIFDRGITSYKWFMNLETWMVPDEFLLRGIFEVAERGGLCVIHAENYGVVTEMVRRYKELGQTKMKVFNERYPSAAEGAALELALAMTEIADARTLIFHNTCIEGVEAIRNARARGVKAYGELGLGWGIFNDDVYRGDPVKALPFLLTPPIRGKEHQARLWHGLAQGDLDIVSTDHTAMWLAPKERALELAASFGIHIPEDEINPIAVDDDGNDLLPLLPPGGAELRLPLVYHYAVNGDIFDVHRWVEVCCSNPASIFDLDEKGYLLPGFDADIVIFDPDKEITIHVENLHSNTNYSVYEGMTMRGVVEKTFSRGKLIVDGDAFVGPQNHGRFIKRSVTG